MLALNHVLGKRVGQVDGPASSLPPLLGTSGLSDHVHITSIAWIPAHGSAYSVICAKVLPPPGSPCNWCSQLPCIQWTPMLSGCCSFLLLEWCFLPLSLAHAGTMWGEPKVAFPCFEEVPLQQQQQQQHLGGGKEAESSGCNGCPVVALWHGRLSGLYRGVGSTLWRCHGCGHSVHLCTKVAARKMQDCHPFDPLLGTFLMI